MQFLILISIVFMFYTNSYSMKEEQLGLDFNVVLDEIVQRSTEKILNTEFLSEDGVKTKLGDNKNITKNSVENDVKSILDSELPEQSLNIIKGKAENYFYPLCRNILPFLLFADYQNNAVWLNEKSKQYKLLEALFYNFASCWYGYSDTSYVIASCLQFFEDGLTENIITDNKLNEKFLPTNNSKILKNIRQAL